MTRKVFFLLATLALSVSAQATTFTFDNNPEPAAELSLVAEEAEGDDEGLFWWSAGANLASNYLWRGYDQSYLGHMFDPSIQPSVTLGLGAFYLDLWLNVSPISTYQEFDMTLGFDYKNLSVTVYDVWCGMGKDFWQNNFFDGANHNLTATIDYTFFDRLRLHWGTTFIHSADWLYNEDGSRKRRAFSSYFEVAYTQPVKELFNIEITAGASPWTGPFWCPTRVGNEFDWDNPAEGFNVTNLSLMLNKEFEMGNVTFPLQVGYIYNPLSNYHYALLKTGFSF